MNGVAQTGTGYDLADFLLGSPTTSSIRYGNPDKYFRSSGYDVFVNDDWRITPRFSLNFGIRWDYATPVTELYNRMVNLEIAPGYSAAVAVPAGSAQLPSSLIHPDRNNFSPRVGFAWRPLQKGSLVVRGGYGAYYNTSVYNIIAGNMAQQPPFAQSLSVSGSAANPLSITNGFLAASGETLTSTFAIDPELSHRIRADLDAYRSNTICRWVCSQRPATWARRGRGWTSSSFRIRWRPAPRYRCCRITSSTKRRMGIRSIMRRSSS